MSDISINNGGSSLLDELIDYMSENDGDFEYLYWYRMHMEGRMDYPRPDDKDMLGLSDEEKHDIQQELIEMSEIKDPEMGGKTILTFVDYMEWETDLIAQTRAMIGDVKYYKIVYTLKGLGGFTTLANEFDLAHVCSLINEAEGGKICLIEETNDDEDIAAYIKLVTYIYDAPHFDNGEPNEMVEIPSLFDDDMDDFEDVDPDDIPENEMEEIEALAEGKFRLCELSYKRLNHSYNEVGYILQAHVIDNESMQELYVSIDTTSKVRGDMFRITDKDYIQMALGDPACMNYLLPFTILYEIPFEKINSNDPYFNYYKFLRIYFKRHFAKNFSRTFLNMRRYFTDDGIL